MPASILTQPLLLSCNVPTMDDFDLSLVTNDEVLAVNQNPLVKQGYRVANQTKEWEVWAKDLADGSKAVALSNLADKDQVIGISKTQPNLTGNDARPLASERHLSPGRRILRDRQPARRRVGQGHAVTGFRMFVGYLSSGL